MGDQDVIDRPNALTKILHESGSTPQTIEQLNAAFQPLLAQAEAMVQETSAIVVTDATQVSAMKRAREKRLELKAVRVAVEKVRKTMKADALEYGRLVEAIAKSLTAVIEPEENRLEDCEKFAERAEAARQLALRNARAEALAPFCSDVSIYPLGTMTEEAFSELLSGLQAAHEKRIADAKKAEEERIAREQAEAAERARIKAENERLKAEAEARERAAKAEREAADKARREAEAKAAAERKVLEEKARKEREAAQEEIRKANAAREAAEAKVKAEAEAKAKAEREAAAAAKKAAAAPDAEKIRQLSKSIRNMAMPDVKSAEAKSLIGVIGVWVHKLAERIDEEVTKLGN